MFLWIWKLQEQVKRFGGIDSLIDYLKSINCNNVCIKYHEGSGPVGGGINFRADFLSYKDNFKAAGITVGTWGYNYFNHWDEEANMIIDALNNSDYYIYDPEVDVSNKFEAAEYICSKVRDTHPNAKIGYSSFPIVSYHEDIPYSVFNKYCDFASPQCYWNEMQWDINRCMNKMINDHKIYGLDKPIIPSIECYKTSNTDKCNYLNYDMDFGMWVLDLIDNESETWLKNNKFEDKLGGTNKVNNIVICGAGADERAAEYLAEHIKCPVVTKENLTPDVIDATKNIFVVGGTWKPKENAVLLTGAGRFDTMQAVLNYINK